MCYRVNCASCGKSTWAGCGLHIASALKDVGTEDRCPNWKKGSRNPCGPVTESSSSGCPLS